MEFAPGGEEASGDAVDVLARGDMPLNTGMHHGGEVVAGTGQEAPAEALAPQPVGEEVGVAVDKVLREVDGPAASGVD